MKKKGRSVLESCRSDWCLRTDEFDFLTLVQHGTHSARAWQCGSGTLRPQLSTLDVAVQDGRGEEGDGVIHREKEQETTEREERCKKVCVGSGWSACLAPVVAVWLVVQEEAPLHPSVSLCEAVVRMLLIGLVWTSLTVCVHLVLHCYRLTHSYMCDKNSKTVYQSSEVEVGRDTLQKQESLIGRWDPSHLRAVVSTLLDGLVVSVLQEPLYDPSLSDLQELLTRLEAVSQALCKSSPVKTPHLQKSDDKEGRENQEESTLKDRVKHICTYLQDRISALHSLLQVQQGYGQCMVDVQQALLEHWTLLEALHTRVTLQPDTRKDPEDPHTVLTDTQSLYTQLSEFRSRVVECQTHLTNSKNLLQELRISHHTLAYTVGLTVDSTWTKHILQGNTQQFEKVHADFTRLEQQTLMFLTHLKDLGVAENQHNFSMSEKHIQASPPSPLSSVPVYIAADRAGPDPEPQPSPRTRSKLSAMNCLCGGRRRR